MTKLLVGDGIKVIVYDISAPLYEIETDADGYLGFHGAVMLEDDEAREQLEHLKQFGKGRNLMQ